MAEQADHLAGKQVDRDAVHRLDATEGDGNIPHLDQWIRAGVGHGRSSRVHFTRLRKMLSTHTARTSTQPRSEEHTSEIQSLMRISYAVFCLKKNKIH